MSEQWIEVTVAATGGLALLLVPRIDMVYDYTPELRALDNDPCPPSTRSLIILRLSGSKTDGDRVAVEDSYDSLRVRLHGPGSGPTR